MTTLFFALCHNDKLLISIKDDIGSVAGDEVYSCPIKCIRDDSTDTYKPCLSHWAAIWDLNNTLYPGYNEQDYCVTNKSMNATSFKSHCKNCSKGNSFAHYGVHVFVTIIKKLLEGTENYKKAYIPEKVQKKGRGRPSKTVTKGSC